MKLSTFVRRVRAYYKKTDKDTDHKYLCACCAWVRIKESEKLRDAYSNPKCAELVELQKQCTEFIDAYIHHKSTVAVYLRSLKNYGECVWPTAKEEHTCRMHILDSILEWALENENCQ